MALPILISCASEKPNEAKIVVVTADSDSARIFQALERKSEATYAGDILSIQAELQLPQFEVPRRLELETKMKMVPLDEKLTNAANGNLCIQTVLVSKNKQDFTQEKWTARLKVDGHWKLTEVRVRPNFLFDLNKNTSTPIPGAYLTICSREKIPDVKEGVELTLLNAAKKPVTKLQWKAPWPPLHEKSANEK